jgi:hypothetical protein
LPSQLNDAVQPSEYFHVTLGGASDAAQLLMVMQDVNGFDSIIRLLSLETVESTTDVDFYRRLSATLERQIDHRI